MTFRGLAAGEVIDLAGECQLRAIEWGADVHLPPGSVQVAEDLARRSHAAGIEYLSYGTYLGVDAPITDPFAALDTAVALGAANVRVWCPFGVGADADDEARRPIVAGLAGAATAAAARGLTLSLEFHPGTLTATAASTNRLLDAVDAPNLFSYWQPAPGAAVPFLVDELTAVRGRLTNLHVFWWTATGERHPLEAGRDAWARLIGLAGEATVALLEFVAGDHPDQFRRDAAVLQDLVRAS